MNNYYDTGSYNETSSARRIISDITRDNFEVPNGFKLSDPSIQNFLSVEKSAEFLVSGSFSVSFSPSGMEICGNGIKTSYRVDCISQIFFTSYTVTEGSGRSRRTVLYYRLMALVRGDNGHEHETLVLEKIPSEYFARYIEQEAEKIMGIEDRPVRGEKDYVKKTRSISDGSAGPLSDLQKEYTSSVLFSEAPVNLNKSVDRVSLTSGNDSFSVLIIGSVILSILLPIIVYMPSRHSHTCNPEGAIWAFGICITVSVLSAIVKLFVMNKYSLEINGNSVLIKVRNCLGNSIDVFRGNISEIDRLYSFDCRKSASDTDESRFSVMIKTKEGKKLTLFAGMSSIDAEEAASAVNSFIMDMEIGMGF